MIPPIGRQGKPLDLGPLRQRHASARGAAADAFGPGRYLGEKPGINAPARPLRGGNREAKDRDQRKRKAASKRLFVKS
jgi:hypothetical protein